MLVNYRYCVNILENLNSNYPVQEYLPELTQMLFKELYTNQPVSTYRRFLQRTFVNNLTGYFNSAKINKGSDALAYTLLTLKELNKRAKAASTTSGDNMTRAHYIQISDQIERALNQNGSVIAAQ